MRWTRCRRRWRGELIFGGRGRVGGCDGDPLGVLGETGGESCGVGADDVLDLPAGHDGGADYGPSVGASGAEARGVGAAGREHELEGVAGFEIVAHGDDAGFAGGGEEEDLDGIAGEEVVDLVGAMALEAVVFIGAVEEVSDGGGAGAAAGEGAGVVGGGGGPAELAAVNFVIPAAGDGLGV